VTWERLSVVVAIAALGAACAKPRPPKKPVAVVEKPKLKLAVLAVESDKFPKVAQAATDSLAKAQVKGMDEVEVSKVSLEVVQLSIECTEPTADCYEAVGKSLAANRLLFAQVGPGVITKGRKRDVRVTITLFDVDTRASQKTAEKVFPNEKDAAAGIDTLISEATN
jgi:hypothetical protein